MTLSAILALALSLNFACSTLTARQNPKKPRMATEMPVGITAPAEVKARLGTLRTKDGFQDAATIERVYDSLDFQRGVQAVLTAMPAASLSAMRKGLRGLGPHNQKVAMFEDLNQVREVLEQVCAQMKVQSDLHAPEVLLTDFGDSAVNYKISVWVENPWDAGPYKSDLNEAIWWSFKDAGIEIAFPQMDVHLDDAFRPPHEQR